MEDIWALCDLVRETGFAVHVYFRHGYPEKVYENALANRLRKQGIDVQQQHALAVFDQDGTAVGHFVADLVVEQKLVVELKSVNHLVAEHQAQLLGYLRGIHLEHGMLVNFGASKFQVRKFALTPSAMPVEMDVLPYDKHI